MITHSGVGSEWEADSADARPGALAEAVETIGGMDAAVEPPRMASRRVSTASARVTGRATEQCPLGPAR